MACFVNNFMQWLEYSLSFFVKKRDSAIAQIFYLSFTQWHKDCLGIFNFLAIEAQAHPLSISFRILYFLWMVFVLSFLFNVPAMFWGWSGFCFVLFFSFNALISNVYIFEFIGRKHSNVPLRPIFYTQGEWKVVRLSQ